MTDTTDTTDTVQYLTIPEALAAIDRCAFHTTETRWQRHGPDIEVERTIVHCFAGGIGSDWDVDRAKDCVRNAHMHEGVLQIAWMDSMLGRCLVVIERADEAGWRRRTFDTVVPAEGAAQVAKNDLAITNLIEDRDRKKAEPLPRKKAEPLPVDVPENSLTDDLDAIELLHDCALTYRTYSYRDDGEHRLHTDETGSFSAYTCPDCSTIVAAVVGKHGKGPVATTRRPRPGRNSAEPKSTDGVR